MDENLRREISDALLKTKSIYINTKEPFTFTSGRISPVYVDCRRLISLVDVRERITKAGEEVLENIDVEVIAGGETAGIPYAAFLSFKVGLPMIYVRKKRKGFGGGRRIEGILEKGQKVLLFEDLVTDGGSKLSFKEAIEEAGGVMEHCLTVFEYRCRRLGLEEGRRNLKKNGVELYSMADWDSVLELAIKMNYFSEEEVNEVYDFLREPAGWGRRKGFTDKEI